MTMLRPLNLLILVLAAQTSSAASACRNGGDFILFKEDPSPSTTPHTETIRVHFTNAGPHLENWREQRPSDGWLHLIGVARLLDSKPGRPSGYFPVYASISSCTAHGFGSMAFGAATYPIWAGEYYLMGKFSADKARFEATFRHVSEE